MKLGRVFKSNHTLFRQAIDQNDTALMAKLMQKQMDLAFVFNVHDPKTFAAIRPDMATFLAQHMTAGVEKKWDCYGTYRSRGSSFLNVIFNSALSHCDDAVLAKAFMTGGNLTPQHQASGILRHITSAEDRQDLLQQIIAQGIDVLEKPEDIVSYLYKQNMTREFDMIVTAGYAPHKDNEALLRMVAACKNHDFARHLVTAHRADIDLAINTARFAGQDAVCDFLTDLRRETCPDAAPLQTFEQMAEELTKLRKTVITLEQTVADLAAQVADLRNPAGKLDKASLRKPFP